MPLDHLPGKRKSLKVSPLAEKHESELLVHHAVGRGVFCTLTLGLQSAYGQNPVATRSEEGSSQAPDISQYSSLNVQFCMQHGFPSIGTGATTVF